MVIFCHIFPFIFMIIDKGSFGNIIRTHVLTRLGLKWRHNKIHELMRMAEAMRRKDICRIHCIDQSKTFTLLLKSKILEFETLSRIHVYRIEHVSYRQGPYRIRIDTADDRIIPALVCMFNLTNSAGL